MNIVWEKLYYRVQALFVFLQKKTIAKKLGLLHSGYRVDLLRTLQPIRAAVPAAGIFIDIGTNKGEFSKIFADIYHPSLIICIEPNAELNNDIKLNTKGHNTVIINKAISDKEGEMEFFVHSDSQMSSLFSSDSELIKRDFGEDDPEKTMKKMVKVTTLDHLFEQYPGEFIDIVVFLKIDTQGNELDVIKGATVALTKVSYCLLEYMFQSPYEKQYDFDELISLMYRNEFSCTGPMHTSYRTTGEAGAVLFLFEKKAKKIFNA